MKVLIATGIYPPEIGGPAEYVRSLARELVRRGDAPTVVTYGDARTERGDGWDVVPVSRSGGPFLRYLRYARTVARLARGADLVYLQGAVSEGLPGTIGAMLARKPTVMRVPGDYAWEMYQQSKVANELLDEFLTHRHSGGIRLLEAIERWTSRAARRIITPSRYIKRVVERWGAPSEKIRVITSCIAPLPATRPRDDARKEFGVADRVVLLTAVRAVPWKGGDFLAGLLKDLPPEFLLVIAGDGPMLDAWNANAAELGVSDRCRFLGRVNRAQLAEWYAAADLFLLATGYEGFPHVVVEAVSMGLPCLVSDQAGNPETKTLFPEYVSVVPYRDREKWIDAIRRRPTRLAPAKIRDFRDAAEDAVAVFKEVCGS